MNYFGKLVFFGHRKRPGKLLLTMKLMLLFTIVLNLQGIASVFSQQQKVNLRMKSATLLEIFEELQRQTGIGFLYKAGDLNDQSRRDAEYGETTLQEVLDKVLAGSKLTYKFENDVILIQLVKRSEQDTKPKTRKLSGMVTDAGTKEPLPGATVIVRKGKQVLTGAACDEKGKYVVVVPENADTLTFSMIGFKPVTVAIKGRSEINIALNEDSGQLEEVSVTGYFRKSKESVTGASVSVSGQEMRKLNPTNIMAALELLDPGLQLIEDNEVGSDPNKMPDFVIRGRSNFIGNPNTPLFILDGFQVSAETVFDLDNNRIDQVTVLKDGSATALYGSRGANGVILITTVSPRGGKLNVDYTFTGTISVPDIRDYNLMDAREKLEYERLAGLYTSATPSEQYNLDERYNAILAEVERGVNTDWLAQPLRTAFTHNHTLYVEGGNDASRFGITARYGDNLGVMKGSSRLRYGLGFKYLYSYQNKLFVRNEIKVDQVEAKNSPYGNFSDYTTPNPYDRMKDEYGEFLYSLSYDMFNPLYEASLGSFSKSKYLEATDNLGVDWNITENLVFRGVASITRRMDRSDQFTDPLSKQFDKVRDNDEITDKYKYLGSYTKGEADYTKFEGNGVLQYYRIIRKHMISVGAGAEMQINNSQSSSSTATGYANGRLTDFGFASTYEIEGTPVSDDSRYRMFGVFANANYGYDNRYFVDFSYRGDGSSKFGKNKKIAPFWSVGGAWNMQNEAFMKDSKTINMLKIRASFGVTGSINYPAYQAQTMYYYDLSHRYEDRIAAKVIAIGNPDLSWQKSHKLNAGVNLEMFRKRLSVTGDVYRTRDKDILIDMNTAPSKGFAAYRQNAGEIENKGFEAKVMGRIIDDKKRLISWTVNASVARNKSKIVHLSAEYKDDAKNVEDVFLLREGESLTALKLVPSAGIDPAVGKEIFITQNNERTFVYDPKYLRMVGDTEPEYYGTFGTYFVYRDLSLNLMFRYKLGADRYNSTVVDKVEKADPKKNSDRRALEKRWKEPGDVCHYRDIKDFNSPVYKTTRFMQEENLLQLASLNVEYRAPKAVAGKLGMDFLSFSFTMNDVFRMSTIKQERGTSYPFAYSYSFALNVRF